MFPFITFLGREYPTYVILGLVGLFLGVIVAVFRTHRYGFTRSEPVYISVFAGFGLLVGSILLFGITQLPYIWENRTYFFSDFLYYVSRFFGGMVFYGGLLGSVIGIYIYCRIMKTHFSLAMKLVLPVFPLAHAVMRIGCFAGGCCYGIEHPSPLGIAFTQAIGAPNNVPLLPVQLYESITNIVIFAILWYYTKKERDWIEIACLYGIIYSFIRFWTEFLRGDAIRGFVLGLSTSQFISVIVFFVSIFLFIRKQKYAKKCYVK